MENFKSPEHIIDVIKAPAHVAIFSYVGDVQ